MAGSRGAFRTLKATQAPSKPKWTRSVQTQSSRCKLATTKIGLLFSSRVYANSWLFCRWISLLGSNNAMRLWRLESKRSHIRNPQRKFSANRSAENKRYCSGLGRKCAFALETYVGHNSSAPRDSVSKPSIAGRLQSHLRYDGHFR